ncbi:type IV secretion system protein [Burkholderia singularis]|uniref:Minor pilin of type IV secretion complex, VirB5 n=1 Tax=Burkholderia singularis TaxID=1503053 RepID=A0A238H043_9BURK|nr:type IV secretion system protein [Burkholderia singularis]SMF98608.1 hypothetical protein BSIN_1888 [Burkholderia singularis]
MQFLNSTLVVAMAVGSFGTAFAGGIPTFDVASVMQLQQTVKQLQDQYKTLKDQYAAITGSYGRGAIGFGDSVNSASVVPGSWQEVVAMQKSGAFGAKQDYYDKQIQPISSDTFQSKQGATSYKMSTDSVRAALAGGDALYSEIQTHLNNLTALGRNVDATANLKDAQDLQNRIATENGLLQTAMAKLNAINMNLQANVLNEQNQSAARNATFFDVK